MLSRIKTKDGKLLSLLFILYGLLYSLHICFLTVLNEFIPEIVSSISGYVILIFALFLAYRVMQAFHNIGRSRGFVLIALLSPFVAFIIYLCVDEISIDDRDRITPLHMKLFWVFIGAFQIALGLVWITASVGMGYLYLGGLGAWIMSVLESIGAFGVIGALAGSTLIVCFLITFLIGVPIWIFHDRYVTSNRLARRASWTAIIPDVSMLSAIISIVVCGLYQARTVMVYRYWDWFYHAPWIALSLTILSVTIFLYRRIQGNHEFALSWWRLRVVILLGAFVAVGVSAFQMLNEKAGCPQSVLEKLVTAQNANGLQNYLSRQQQCRQHVTVDRVTDNLLSTSSPDIGPELFQQKKRAMLTVLFSRVSKDHVIDWQNIQYHTGKEGIQLVLDALREAHVPASGFSEKNLGDMVSRWNEENDLESLKLFISYGLRFDSPDWNNRAFGLVVTALEKPRPSWKFYDALIGAGLPVSTRLQALANAIRTGSADTLKSWTRDDWSNSANDGEKVEWIDKNVFSLRWLAVMYTSDDTLRATFMSMAGTDLQHMVLETALPWRCELAKRAGPRMILDSMASLPANDFDRTRCEDYLERHFKEHK